MLDGTKKGDLVMDPLSILTLIGTGLGLVDKFYDLNKKILGENPGDHRVSVEPQQNKLVIIDNSYRQEVNADDLNLNNFDQIRHDALRETIRINWETFNGLYVERARASADEKVRLKIRMDDLKSELCPDFKELVRMYEEVIGISLPDHYTLYRVCA
jgi:hypothetical protein